MITAYLYNSCTSCRKAADLLKEEGANFEVREYFKEKLTKDELTGLLASTGLRLEEVLSTRSTPYRERELASKTLRDDEIIALMLEEPRLLKRPILVSGSHAVVGYKVNDIRDLVAQDGKA